MTDYNDHNDGNWHRWQGCLCPVHPKSVVHVIWHDEDTCACGRSFDVAGAIDWSMVLKFLVEDEYVEPPKPRECWINEYPGRETRTVHTSAEDATRVLSSIPRNTTRWIEVLE